MNYKKPNNDTKTRIYLMDEIRGFAVLCMVFFHAFYTLAYLFKLDWAHILLKFFTPAEPFFAAAFIFIAGISSNLSQSNLKRGLKLLAVAIIVSVVTYFISPSNLIVFGILHFLAICMILFSFLQKPFEKLSPIWLFALLSSLLFFFTFPIRNGFLGFGDLQILPLPSLLYQSNWLMMFGFHNPSFISADYFPIFPWIFIFLAGTLIGRYAKMGKFPNFTYKSRVPFFSWIGRHALIIYILHQPLIYGVSSLVQIILSGGI